MAVVLIVALLNNQPTNVIAPMSSFEHAKQVSKGEKEACLKANDQALAAVTKDDAFTDKEHKFSKFQLAASEGIMDVPAGTNFELAVNAYDSKVVTGTLDYEKGYGSYNYKIQKLSGAGEWKFESMVACKK